MMNNILARTYRQMTVKNKNLKKMMMTITRMKIKLKMAKKTPGMKMSTLMIQMIQMKKKMMTTKIRNL